MKGDYTRFTFDPDKHYKNVLKQQGRVDLDADWNEQQAIQTYYRETLAGDIVGASGAPEDNAGFDISILNDKPVISAGHYYIEGSLCYNNADSLPVSDQVNLPALEMPQVDGRYIAYLDVYDRHITSVEDYGVREVALNGPDTATRIQNLWQVKLLRVGADGSPFHCLSTSKLWTNMVQGSTVKLAAQAKAGRESNQNPCIISPDAGYRRLENQLYRVEIHNGGTHAQASWKWSRNNGAQLAKWTGEDGNTFKISQGKHNYFGGFRNGQWVELTDDKHELQGIPGTLVRVELVKDNEIVIEHGTATGPTSLAHFPLNPKIRGWDSIGEAKVNQHGDDDGWILLEDGVQVKFQGGIQKTGDYWTIPARTNIGDVEWPKDGVDPKFVEPHGVEHHYARLATLDMVGNEWKKINDCRSLFPSLTDLIQLSYIGGDAQSSMPDPSAPNDKLLLAKPLKVGVSRGGNPVDGVRVRFKIKNGDGALNGGASDEFIDTTGPAGIASCRWAIGSQLAVQTLEADLLDASNVEKHLPIHFHAILNRADIVSYDPVNVPELAGVKTVQEAIDSLAKIGHEGCVTYVVQPGDHWQDLFDEIKDGEDAHICFQRGTYELDSPLRLSKKGHLKVTGAGKGSRIIARSSESALEFSSCSSLSIRDLYIESGNSVLNGKDNNIMGTLTVEDVPNVSIRDLSVKCAGAPDLRRACITVKNGEGKSIDKVTPAICVTVSDCDLKVGHKQNAMLLVNIDKSTVTGNCVKVVPKPKSLNFSKQLESKKMRTKLQSMLIGSPVIAEAVIKNGRVNAHKVGPYTLIVKSTVPEYEWDALIKENPPKEVETKSKEGVVKYFEELTAKATKKPSVLKSYDKGVRTLEKDIGEVVFKDLVETPHGKAILKNMLVSGKVRVEEFDETNNTDHNTTISYSGSRVSMNSVLPEKTWVRMLKSEKVRPASNEDLLKEMQLIAGKIITNTTFRNKFSEVRKWFDGLAKRNPAVASKGIVCGGSHLGHVFISANILDGIEDAVHVGVSHSTKNPKEIDQIKSVLIQDNVFNLRKPAEKAQGNRGVFVGNSDSVRVERNEILLVTNNPKESFQHGIKIYGKLGCMLMIRENVTKGCDAGLYMVSLESDKKGNKQWLAGDNLFLNVSGEAIIAPSSLRRLNNVSG